MTLYTNTELTMLIIALAISILISTVGSFLIRRNFDDCGTFIAAVGTIICIVVLFLLGWFAIGSKMQRVNEPLTYQSNVELRNSLQQAIDNSEDVVNTDLYLRAVDFNTDLAEIKAAQADPRCTMSFSGKVDWSTIEPIDLKVD